MLSHPYDPGTHLHEHAGCCANDRQVPPVSSAAYVTSANPLVAVTDACAVNPALTAWIENVVDVRVESALKRFRETDVAQVFRDTLASCQNSAAIVAQQSCQAEAAARQRLETELRGLADAQVRMLAVVESISGDQEQQHATSGWAFGRMMSTVGELQRSLEQEGDGAASVLRQHETALREVVRAQAENATRHRASMAELQKALAEDSARHRTAIENLRLFVASASPSPSLGRDEFTKVTESVAALQQEVQTLSHDVKHLDDKWTAFCKDSSGQIHEEVHAAVAASASTGRQSFESMAREGQNEMRAELQQAQQDIQEDIMNHQQKLWTELRAETRGLFKSEQSAIAALDEQLWLTEQRVGRRIDELERAQLGPAQDAHNQNCPRPCDVARHMRATAVDPGGARRVGSSRLSDAEQLELLRSARSRLLPGGGV